MKTFTQNESKEGITLLNPDEGSRVTIEVPLQKMFDELISFISLADKE